MSKLLTATELAKALRVGRNYVWRLSREGRIPVIRVGRACRYDEAAVLAALQKPKESK